MFATHVTSTGRRMMICQMDDAHLVNTICLLLRRAEEAKGAIAHQPDATSPFAKALYGVQEVDPAQAAGVVRLIIEQMYPYIAEIVLRGLPVIDKIRDELRLLVDRPTGTAMVRTMLLLPPRRVYDDDDPEGWGDTWHPGHPDNFGDQ
jgi:hypothetical protein